MGKTKTKSAQKKELAFIFQNKGIYLYLLTLERLKILENYLDQKNE